VNPVDDTPQFRNTSAFSVRSKTVQAIHSPLAFFALSLLIVETFLLGAGSLFDLSPGWRIAALATGVVLFLAVTGTVVWLVVRYPQNLVFSEESHVQYARMQLFGSEDERLTGRDLARLLPESNPEPLLGQPTDVQSTT
jgi:hypothetical protein